MRGESATCRQELEWALKLSTLKYRHVMRARNHSDRGRRGRGDGFVREELARLNRNLRIATKDEPHRRIKVSPRTFSDLVRNPIAAFRNPGRPSLLNVYEQLGLLEGIDSRADR